MARTRRIPLVQRPTTRLAAAITTVALIVVITYALALAGCSSPAAQSAVHHTPVHVAAATSGPAMPAILKHWGWRKAIERSGFEQSEEWTP